MSYLPRQLDITTTDGPLQKSLDGTQIYGLVLLDATVSTGNNDLTAGASLSRITNIYGGVNRSNGDFNPVPQIDGALSVTWAIAFISLVSDTDLRVIIGSAWTGTNNVLSNGVYVMEYFR